MAEYKYVGDGMGVPGLPHLISDQEAERLGVSALLAEAIKNGSYIEVRPSTAVSFDYAAKGAAPLRTNKKKESE